MSSATSERLATRARWRVSIAGVVQGVGFRPFVYRCATEFGLKGWVANSTDGVLLEIEGEAETLDAMLRALRAKAPATAIVNNIATQVIDVCNEAEFSVRPSVSSSVSQIAMPADSSTCDACVAELFDPGNRRYHYPFINCTQCGPRYTIMHAAPYDRCRTSMRDFAMCPECAHEYADPGNRRFHAEPNACPACGPTLAFWNTDGAVLATHASALTEAIALIRGGSIVAIKSLGGFQLLIDATNSDAIARLRVSKQRPDKPFALMCDSIAQARRLCDISDQEAWLLQSPPAPIVLLARRTDANRLNLPDNVAPNNPLLGIMLPFTPLHHLLMRELSVPLIATSGNLGDEPLAFEEHNAVTRLRNIADGFLVHDRAIVRPCDDSVVRIMGARPMVLRRARGYAPLPIRTAQSDWRVLAVGGHLKNTVTLSGNGQATMSPHIGDLSTALARERFEAQRSLLPELLHTEVDVVAHDLHPDYASGNVIITQCRVAVQHHIAHIAACIGEHDIAGPVLGVAWDGAGYGVDGTLWGGEFIAIDCAQWQRVAHLRTFCLPGGEAAMHEPRRSALGVLFELFGQQVFHHPLANTLFAAHEQETLLAMLERSVNSPRTSSVGRLFDAVAALCGLRQRCTYEGQAAMELEWSIDPHLSVAPYQFEIRSEPSRDAAFVIDWAPAITALLDDMQCHRGVAHIAACFHLGLVQVIAETARQLGFRQVALSGGCFQNRYLLEHAVEKLHGLGLIPYWPQRVPPNDGGLSFGQAIWAQRVLEAH